MKNTIKIFAALLVATMSFTSANAQYSCSSPIIVTPQATCILQSFNTSNTLVWFQFVAGSEKARFTTGTSGNNIFEITLYGGTCNALNVLTSIAAATGDDDLILYTNGLTAGNTYFIRVQATAGSLIEYCLEDVTLSWDDFALLAGGNIDAMRTIKSKGCVGATGTKSDALYTSYTSTNTQVAKSIADLNSTISQFNNRPATSTLTQLGGQTLDAGVYDINGNTTFNDGLTLTGDVNSIYVFRISGNLTVRDNGMVFYGNVNPKNIFWVVNGDVTLNRYIQFHGIVISNSNITVTSDFYGQLSMLTPGGNISLSYSGKYHSFCPCSSSNLSPPASNPPPPPPAATSITCPTYIWSNKINRTTSNETGISVSTDPSGNIYNTGKFGMLSSTPNPTATFGISPFINMTSHGFVDVYVSKFSACGVIQWVAGAGCMGQIFNTEEVGCIATDANGDSYIIGKAGASPLYFYNSSGQNIITLTMTGELFIAKINSQGVWQWAVCVPQTITMDAFNIEGMGIAVDNLGHVYITGKITGGGTDTYTFGSTILTPISMDLFVAKMDASNGQFIWAKRAGGTSFDEANSVTVDGQNNILICGEFGMTTGNGTGTPATFGSITLTPNFNGEIFAAKLDAAGNWLWATQAGCNLTTNGGADFANHIKAGVSGDAYVTGDTKRSGFFGTFPFSCSSVFGESFVAKISSGGTWQWLRYTFSGVGDFVSAFSIDVDEYENSYVAGSFSGTTYFFSSTMIAGAGGSAQFSALNSSGGGLWDMSAACTNAGATFPPSATEVSYFNSAIAITGAYSGNIGVANPTLTSGLSDMAGYVTKICVGNYAVSVSATATTICEGESVTLTASGGNIYTWSPMTGLSVPFPATFDNSIMIATPTTTTIYTVTSTTPDGCGTSSATITITVKPFTQPTITGVNNNCDLPASFTVNTPYIAPALMSWKFYDVAGNDITASMAGNYFVSGYTLTLLSWGPFTDGEICVTVINQNNGCQATVCQPVYNCCHTCGGTVAYATWNDIDVSTVLSTYPQFFDPGAGTPTLATDANISINGTFTINTDLIIQDCPNICLGTNAQIKILAGVTLTLTSPLINISPSGPYLGNPTTLFGNPNALPTKLYAGCGYMWDRIYLENSSAKLIVNPAPVTNVTTITQARNAVVSDNGGEYQIQYALLENNNTDITVNAYSGTPHLGTITRSTLTSTTGAMLPYFIGSSPQNPLQRTHIGMEVNSVDDINIGSALFNRNIFDNMDFGIKTDNSGVTIKNNLFQHIKRITPCPFYTPCNQEGYAIFSIGNLNAATLPGRYLTVGGTPFTSEINEFDDCQYGIAAYTHLTINVLGNYMHDFVAPPLQQNPTSIAVLCWNHKLKDITISTNRITNFQRGIECRYIANGAPVVANPVYTHLYIYDNTLTNGKIGVWAQNVIPAINTFGSNVHVFAPTLTSATMPHFVDVNIAVTVGNVQSSFVHDLYIKYNSQPVPPTSFYGVRALNNSYFTHIRGNKIQCSSIPNNSLVNYMRGIALESSMAANAINNKITKMGTGIRVFSSNTNSRLYCNEMYDDYIGVGLANTNLGPQLAGQVPQDNQWFGLSHTQSTDITKIGSNLPQVWTYRDNNLASFIPNYQLLPLAIIANPVQPATAPTCTTSTPQAIANPDDREKELGPIVRHTLVFEENADENWYNANLYAYRVMKADPDILNFNHPDDYLYQDFYAAMEASGAGKIDEVHQLLKDGDLEGAKEEGGKIPGGNEQDANCKAVLLIYMETVEKGIYDYTEAQYTTLFSIAVKNPLYGGTCVYDARTMLGLDLDDDADENMRKNNHTATEKSFTVYPNPNDGNMQIDYTLAEGESGVFELYDFTGKKLVEHQLVEGTHTLHLSEQELSNGIYFGKVIINNESVYNGKIVIMK